MHHPSVRVVSSLTSALLVGLLTVGCGTRTEDTASFSPTNNTSQPAADTDAGPVTDQPVGSPSAAETSEPGSAAAPSAPVPSGPSGSVAGAAAGSAPNRSTGAAAATPNRKPAPAASAGPSARPVPEPGDPAPGKPAPGKPAVPAQPGSKSPLIVASVGTLSGVAGNVLKPLVAGAQVWVKYINQRGGTNGHQVRLLLFDDGADPARHRTLVQEAVERHHALALVVNTEVFTGRGSVEYINQKRIPVVGTMAGIQWAYDSPMYFPQQTEADDQYVAYTASVGRQAIPRGKKKFGILTCTEAQACTDGARVAASSAATLGLEHVHTGKMSLAQPDFTAECLAARNAEVEVLMLFMDTNSVGRVAAGCTRQGFKPLYATAASIAADRQKEDPNLEGMVVGSLVFPWFMTGTPATDEYHRAMREHGTGITPGVPPATGWTGGKLLEAATRNLPEPPTSEAILQGLWKIKNDDLGGITRPLTFIENRPATRQICWFDMTIKGGEWVSPDGFKRHCR